MVEKGRRSKSLAWFCWRIEGDDVSQGEKTPISIPCAATVVGTRIPREHDIFSGCCTPSKISKQRLAPLSWIRPGGCSTVYSRPSPAIAYWVGWSVWWWRGACSLPSKTPVSNCRSCNGILWPISTIDLSSLFGKYWPLAAAIYKCNPGQWRLREFRGHQPCMILHSGVNWATEVLLIYW